VHVPTLDVDPADAHSGWRSVRVAAAPRYDKLDLDRTGRWTSQSGQDNTVFNLLGRKRRGYFVDLAANHAVFLSNTRALERDHDWHGLCIEPNPRYWNLLASQRNCTVVGAAVSTDRRQATFIDGSTNGKIIKNATELKNIKPEWDSTWAKRPTGGFFSVITTTFDDILERFHPPPVIDYLSLDVEGAEELVMGQFPFDRFNISILTTERASPRLQSKLKAAGLRPLCYHGKYGDRLWLNEAVEMPAAAASLQFDETKWCPQFPE